MTTQGDVIEMARPVRRKTKRHAEDVQHSSVFCDWGTPDEVYDPLDRYFGFGLDVCASAENRKCENYFGLDHPDESRRNALTADWLAAADGDAAFFNPPFSQELHSPIEPWVDKAAYEAERGLTVVGLLPASVQTDWWKRHVRKADEIWFCQHRIKYVASAAMLAEINRRRVAAGKKPVAKAWGAGNNSAVVIWRPDPGFVGNVDPITRYWSWRKAA
jgi:phage N-6-adenine-methyltransferase